MFNRILLELPVCLNKFGLKKVVFLWAALVLLGYGSMVFYSIAPAKSLTTVGTFPLVSKLSCTSGLTLITFLHPQCSCSRATVSELESLLTQNNLSTSVRAYAVISRPSGCSEAFVRGPIIDSLSQIKNVQVMIDKDDVESRRFGARASGQTLLFDGNGKCLFSGGITAARGEVGDNAGVEALRQCIAGGRTSISRTPVFGCSLESSQ